MSRPRHGGQRAWAVTLANCPDSALLDFSASISPFKPPEGVLRAIVAALPQLGYYPDPTYNSLRWAGGQVWGLPPDWILPGNGSAELLTLAGRALSACWETVIIEPAFGDYARALQGSGAKIRPVVWPVFEPFPLQTLLALGDRRRGLILNNPHNPSGHLLTQAEILACLERFAWVVVDEAFMDFLPPCDQQSLIAFLPQFPQLIILKSLTKFYALAGLRLGFALGHPQILESWQHWRDPWPVNSLAVSAAIAAWQESSFASQLWAWLPPARQALFEALQSFSALTPRPSAANFLLVKTRLPAPELQLQLLTKHRILIRDCLSFPSLGEHFFRVAVRTPAENQQLIDALEAVLAVNSFG